MRLLLLLLTVINASCVSTFALEKRVMENFATLDPVAPVLEAAKPQRHLAKSFSEVKTASVPTIEPEWGIFLSEDPERGSVGDVFSTQGSIYANSNPTRYTDPTGRIGMSATQERMTLAAIAEVNNDPEARAAASAVRHGIAQTNKDFGSYVGDTVFESSVTLGIDPMQAANSSAVFATANEFVGGIGAFVAGAVIDPIGTTEDIVRSPATAGQMFGMATEPGISTRTRWERIAAGIGAAASFVAVVAGSARAMVSGKGAGNSDTYGIGEAIKGDLAADVVLKAATEGRGSGLAKAWKPNVQTFKNLLGDGPIGTRGAGPLTKVGGKWKVEVGGRLRSIKNGVYNFVQINGQLVGGKLMANRPGPQINGHVSLSKNASVEFAGQVTFKGGEIFEWSNDSGHYLIPTSAAEQVVNLPPSLFKGVTSK